MDELLKRIAVNPNVMVGKPVIRGTRITVQHIMRELAGGMSTAEILDAYPHLTADDIRAAFAYVASSLADEQVVIDAAE